MAFEGLHENLIRRQKAAIANLDPATVAEIEKLSALYKSCVGDNKFLYKAAPEYVALVNEEALLFYNNSPIHRESFDHQIFTKMAEDIVKSHNGNPEKYKVLIEKCLSSRS